MNWIVIAGCIGFLFVWSFLLVKGKWFITKWPQWLRLTSMLAVTAGMFALVWYMKSEETKHEATMMGLCWQGDQAVYPEKWGVNANCDDPQPLDWKKSPKLVYWGFPEDFDTYRSSHEHALKFWNKELGHNHFIETDSKDLADVLIVWGSANEGAGAMSTSHKRVNGNIVATITVKKPGDIRRWMLEEQHEFGHVLGLAHDRSGIMNPELEEGEEMKVWLLHSKDRNAVLDSLKPKESPASSDPSESE